MDAAYQCSLAKKRKTINNPSCLLCTSSSSEKLVSHPSSDTYKKLVDCIAERQCYGDEQCENIVNQFDDDFSVDSMKKQNIAWHRSCYQRITHKKHIELLKKKHEERLNEPLEEACASTSESCSIKLTRSQTRNYIKEHCFFFVTSHVLEELN